MDEMGKDDSRHGSRKERNRTLVAAGIIIAAIIVLVTVAAIADIFTRKVAKEEVVDPFADLGGTIYLTLIPEDGDRDGRGYLDVDIYAYNLESKSLKKAFPDELVKGFVDFSDDGNFLVYAAAPYDPGIPSNGVLPISELPQLYTHDLRTGEKRKITRQDAPRIRLLSLSPDGDKIAYIAHKEMQYYETYLPDDWEIYVSDMEGNIELAGKGFHPFWSPGGEMLLAASNDGLYIYQLGSGAKTKVFDFGWPADEYMRFGVSNDRSHFAWSFPRGGGISVFKIQSWDPFIMQPFDVITVEGSRLAYWPVFSPDNRYVAFAEHDVVAGSLENSTIIVYDSRTSRRKKFAVPDTFLANAFMINTWVN